jgi:CHAD domain-containing protein
MPYRFKTEEPVEHGFRRIAREQFDASLAELAGPEVGAKNVHECRKSLKRLRALVRLVAGAIGEGKARRRNKALGEIARLLSARRDQTVMLETIAKLSHEVLDSAAALDSLKTELTSRTPNAPETLEPDVAERARLLLVREAKKASRMKFDTRGFRALSKGLEDSYGRGWKAFKYAYDEPTDDNFHDLRKAVQWHWRQMSLVSKAWPDEFSVRAHAARELSQLLGDDHDLAVLAAAAAQASTLSDEEKAAAVSVCRAQQKSLRATAEYRAKRLFAENPKTFVHRVAVYWRCSRSLDPRLDVQAEPRQVAAMLDVAPPVADGKDTAEKRRVPAKPRLAAKSDAPASAQRRA